MIQVKCIDKFRDGQGKICGYRLMDVYGNTQDMFSDILKEQIRNKEISVINLTLTSDGRLIDGSEKTSKNENTKKSNLGPMMNVLRDFNGIAGNLIGSYNLPLLENRRMELDSDGNPIIIAKAVNKGNKPIIVMSTEGVYITDVNNTVRVDGDIELMKNYLRTEMYNSDSSKKNSLVELKDFVCNFAEKKHLGKVQYRRYDKSEDEDGFAIFIVDATSNSNFKYKVKMDIAESGVYMTMDVKDKEMPNYNSINCDLDKTNVLGLMNYLVYIVQNQILSSDKLSICNGEIWNVL